MSINKMDLEHKVQRYIDMYDFYMSSYRYSLDDLLNLTNDFYEFIAAEKKKILDEDILFEKVKNELFCEDLKFESEYRNCLCDMYPSFDTPTINLLVSTLLTADDLESEMTTRIATDPRFKELDAEDFAKL